MKQILTIVTLCSLASLQPAVAESPAKPEVLFSDSFNGMAENSIAENSSWKVVGTAVYSTAGGEGTGVKLTLPASTPRDSHILYPVSHIVGENDVVTLTVRYNIATEGGVAPVQIRGKGGMGKLEAALCPSGKNVWVVYNPVNSPENKDREPGVKRDGWVKIIYNNKNSTVAYFYSDVASAAVPTEWTPGTGSPLTLPADQKLSEITGVYLGVNVNETDASELESSYFGSVTLSVAQ